jgi:hypothetical protein
MWGQVAKGTIETYFVKLPLIYNPFMSCYLTMNFYFKTFIFKKKLDIKLTIHLTLCAT